MYKIGELSRLCRVPVKTLRFYADKGLLPPDQVDPFTGYRYYAPGRLRDVNRILGLKELGFTLEEIRRHLKTGDDASIILLLDGKTAELTQLQDQTAERLRRLSAVRECLTQEACLPITVTFRSSESFHVPLERRTFTTLDEAREQAGALLTGQAGERAVIVNYETDYRDDGVLDLAVGRLPNAGGAVRNSDGLDASILCRRKELDNAYLLLLRILRENHYQITGAFTEILYDGETTELRVPVCKLTELPRPRNDEINLPFEDDPWAVGRWEFADLVPSPAHYRPGRRKYGGEVSFPELYFLAGGERYWCFGWTKGFLLFSFGYPKRRGWNPYRIVRVDGIPTMFIEMKTDEYFLYGGQPEVLVYQQADARPRTAADIRMRDDTALPFLSEDGIAGRWNSIGFARTPEAFMEEAASALPPEALYWKWVEFAPEGSCKVQYGEKAPLQLAWTRGFLLNHEASLTEKYMRREQAGRSLLFIQWKSGDYYFGRREPWFYVFEKDN